MESMADALELEIATLAARMAAGECRFLTRVRQLEDVIVLADCTYAEWLSWKCGMDKTTAYEKVRVARALAALPVIETAFAEGRITYSKVRVVTRIANATTDATMRGMLWTAPCASSSGSLRRIAKSITQRHVATWRHGTSRSCGMTTAW